MMMTMNDSMGFAAPQPPRSNSFEDETETLYYSAPAYRPDERGGPHFSALSVSPIKMELDDYGAVVNPAEITGQSLAVKMETDKMNVLQSFDLEKFVNDQAADVAIPEVEETQDLIQEMEDFLSQYEENRVPDPEFDDLADQLLNMEQQQTLNSMDTSCPVANHDLSPEEVAAAEDLIDELLEEKNSNDDSGIESSFNVSNVSQINTSEGNVIIIIAPPEDSLSSSADSDSDWVPSSPDLSKKKPGRKLSSRQPVKALTTGKVGKKSYRTIKDKKERKKIQNVMAARRYRDKKKLEAQEAENEEQTLMRKNRELKDQLKDIENEMKTMKKLMVELGIFKVKKK